MIRTSNPRTFMHRGMKHIVVATAVAMLAGLLYAQTPPAWWDSPNKGTPELVFAKGSAAGADTETSARDQAYHRALAHLKKRITSQEDIWPLINIIGSDIAFEHLEKDSRGRWHAWVLVSYPKAQFDVALKRAKDSTKRIPVFIAPLAFGPESEEQYPEVVAKYKKLGYGNAIWQTVEDLMYEAGYEIVTSPQSQTQSMLQKMLQQDAASGGESTLPKMVLLCNMNFFEIKTEEMSWGKTIRNSEYHAELLLEMYRVGGGTAKNVKIPAKGEARDKNLLQATQEASEEAVTKLVDRIKKAKWTN